jgi:hypothetical protein
MKSNRSLIISIAILTGLLLIFTQGFAQHHGNIKGDGNIKSQARAIKDFSRVDCSGTFHIFITQGNNTSVKVEADQNLLSYIITEVSGDKLTIKTKKNVNINPSRPVNVYLSTKQIKALNLSGVCKVQTQNTLQADHLKVGISGSSDMNLQLKSTSFTSDISGTGKLTLQGNTTSAAYNISGTADVKATDFISDNTEVQISGMGKLHVNASKKLEVSVSGMGKVWYKGKPAISESISGMGKVTAE